MLPRLPTPPHQPTQPCRQNKTVANKMSVDLLPSTNSRQTIIISTQFGGARCVRYTIRADTSAAVGPTRPDNRLAAAGNTRPDIWPATADNTRPDICLLINRKTYLSVASAQTGNNGGRPAAHVSSAHPPARLAARPSARPLARPHAHPTVRTR